MAPKFEKIAEGAVLGEAPHWDIPTQTLYFVDIHGKTINKYDPATKKHTKASVAPEGSSFILPIQGKKDHFVVPLTKKLVIIKWDGVSDKYEVVEKLNEATYPFNDGKADSTGRVWGGTLNLNAENLELTQADGSLMSFGPNREFKSRLDNIKISNGLTWNEKLKKFYHIDSLKHAIHEYDFDVKTGTLSNGKQLFSIKTFNIPGIPDGLTIDADGNLWLAIFGGGRILKIDPKKTDTLLETIEMPTAQVTSLAFGGKNLDELYVTTGALEIEGNKPNLPEAGATYKITGLGVKGLPMTSAVV